MRSLRFALVAASLVVSTAFASPADPKSGVEYLTLAQPQPTQTVGKKVEVIEFFMYHCPACNALEPSIAQWVKKQGDNINFKRVHMPARGPNDPEAHLYLTLEAMGKLEEVHPKVFKAMHVDRVRLDSDEAMINWAAKNGLDRAKFTEVWNSFGVTTKLRRIPQVLSNYKVDSVPTVVVDGKYMTSPAVAGKASGATTMAQAQQATLQVLDALVAKAAKTK
jgi:thiol:disulfide interchange protein DsbA